MSELPVSLPAARPQLQVLLAAETQRPYAAVPSAWLWELVEYLSYHRVAVRYHHQAEGFLVSFEHSTPAAAQRVLADWAG